MRERDPASSAGESQEIAKRLQEAIKELNSITGEVETLKEQASSEDREKKLNEMTVRFWEALFGPQSEVSKERIVESFTSLREIMKDFENWDKGIVAQETVDKINAFRLEHGLEPTKVKATI